MAELLIPFAASILAILFSVYLIFDVRKRPAGTKKMQDISGAVRQGAMAYLAREYKTIAVFLIIIFLALFVLLPGPSNLPTAITFLFGAIFSASAGYIGMKMAVTANVRTAAAAEKGLKQALDVAFRGGAVTGMLVVGLSLLGIVISLYLFKEPILIVGFGFGASLVSLFARIGGGIYTKAADVGADLVGKVEAGIPEDDPRNPAVIADNVGDNVGDCAGMAADLFETYAVTVIASMLLGSLLASTVGPSGINMPLQIASASIIASIIGTFFVRLGRSGNIMRALYKGLIASVIVAAIIFYFIIPEFRFLISAYIGLFVALIFFAITEYYTGKSWPPVKGIAEASRTGPATNIISGISVGLISTWMPTVVVVAGILLSNYFAGLYGIAIAVTAMLGMAGMIIALDSYGPITDNAGGIAEMAGLDKKVRKVTDALDAVGNTTKAVTKSFAIGSAALAALTLFAAFMIEVEKERIKIGKLDTLVFSLSDPNVLAGLMIGALIPFVFASLVISSVGRGAFSVVEEVRRQFKLGILEGKAKPDYAKAVDIVTQAALKEMSLPALIAVLAPLVVGLLLGPLALGGLLLGCILTGFLMAIQMSTGGGAWDNAKKYIEDGHLGGKGSDAHKAAVVGDTVGDPYKDTAGPAINPLIKVMNTIAIIFISVIVAFSLM